MDHGNIKPLWGETIVGLRSGQACSLVCSHYNTALLLLKGELPASPHHPVASARKQTEFQQHFHERGSSMWRCLLWIENLFCLMQTQSKHFDLTNKGFTLLRSHFFLQCFSLLHQWTMYRNIPAKWAKITSWTVDSTMPWYILYVPIVPMGHHGDHRQRCAGIKINSKGNLLIWGIKTRGGTPGDSHHSENKSHKYLREYYTYMLPKSRPFVLGYTDSLLCTELFEKPERHSNDFLHAQLGFDYISSSCVASVI